MEEICIKVVLINQVDQQRFRCFRWFRRWFRSYLVQARVRKEVAANKRTTAVTV